MNNFPNFISSSPDSIYFLWQVKVQHYNFIKLGIPKNKIFVIVGYRHSISKEWLEYKETSGVNILFYEDTRVNLSYVSAIRPHVLAKFYKEYPGMKKEWVFYHDADMIFNNLPNFSSMMESNSWKVSDTISYIGYNYIAEKGADVLLDMCEIVGIPPLIVRANQNKSGGCQYLLRNVNYEYWEKVEKDSEELYTKISNNNSSYLEAWKKYSKNHTGTYDSIQIWCADMWAVLWNAWLIGQDTIVHTELSFSWGTHSIHDYNAHNIFHNAGVLEKDRDRLFYKGDYITKIPFDVDFSYIADDTASKQYVKLFKEIGK